MNKLVSLLVLISYMNCLSSKSSVVFYKSVCQFHLPHRKQSLFVQRSTFMVFFELKMLILRSVHKLLVCFIFRCKSLTVSCLVFTLHVFFCL